MSTIRKIIPFSLYDIPGLEQWLEGQANQGLFPTHLGSWATFEDRGVPGTRFRLDPFANRAGEGLEPTQEKLELYRQAGWEYAFRVGRAYFCLLYTSRTRGRVRLGPGTLYTLLAKFQDEGFIQETEVDGRKRTDRLTDQGRQAYHEELDRLRACVLDGEEEER